MFLQNVSTNRKSFNPRVLKWRGNVITSSSVALRWRLVIAQIVLYVQILLAKHIFDHHLLILCFYLISSCITNYTMFVCLSPWHSNQNGKIKWLLPSSAYLPLALFIIFMKVYHPWLKMQLKVFEACYVVILKQIWFYIPIQECSHWPPCQVFYFNMLWILSITYL